MQYIIDGYNLLFLHLTPCEDLRTSRDELINQLDKQFGFLGINATIVFDGFNSENLSESYKYFENLDIVFTRKSLTADEFIINYLRSNKNNKDIMLITNDNELSTKARNLNAQTQKARIFLKQISKKYSKKIKQDALFSKDFEETKFHIERLLQIFEQKLTENDFFET